MVAVADYFSVKHRRIEGVGVTPDMPVDADTTQDVALGL
jgi:C-terminal processing protease CtpA/Prc